jgi:hypothetical protein
VVVGETLIDVPVTVPMPLIEREVALVVVHESLEVAPGAMVVGLAVKLVIVGGGTTVTVAWAVAEPELLVAVSV